MNQKLLLTLITSLLCLGFLQAQPGNMNCGVCVVDTDCPTLQPDGGICPAIIPDAQIGVAYNFPVTFYMPEVLSVTEPIETDVRLDNVEIVELINLPAGLEWECNFNDCIYEPSSNPPTSELGCVTICGTPNAAPGVYSINIRLLADVFVIAAGISLADQEQFYTVEVTVLPPNVPIGFNEITGCGNLSDTLTALLDFNPDQPTEWNWNLGNGQTGTGNEIISNYTNAGSYDAVLETTVYDYVVTDFCITSIPDGYCGDIEEAACSCGTPVFGQCPDPYVSILGTTLPAADDTQSHCWNGLNFITGGLNFSFSVFDEDGGPPLGSDNDLLGDFNLAITGTGTYPFSNANVVGTVTIGTQLNSVSLDTLPITVFADPPQGALTINGNEVEVTNAAGYDIQWYLDGVLVSGATSSTYSPSMSGACTVELTDPATGCSSLSAPITVVLSAVENALSEASVLSLFPNPANAKAFLDIQFESSQEVEIEIMDALGRTVSNQVYNNQIGQQRYELNLIGLSNSLYFVQIRLSNGSQMTKRLLVY